CPCPLYSRDSTQEGHTIPHHHQVDGSSHGNPPERCPHSLYSRDSTQEGHTIPHHHQVAELKDSKIEVKEEEDEKFMYGDQQSMEGSGHLYSQDSTQEDHTIPHHFQVDGIEQNKLFQAKRRFLYEELKYIKVEVKEEEEETFVSGNQQSMEEGEMIMKSKPEELSLHIEARGDTGHHMKGPSPFLNITSCSQQMRRRYWT
ncbi:unnamed protein product, partial [Staurois parvus]